MRFLSTLVGLCILSVAFGQAGRPAYLCEVLLDNFCPGDQSLCPQDPSLTFGGSSYGFENFNLISFDSFTAGTGDVEGRVAIKNNLNLPVAGYSVGYELRTGGVAAADASLPYSLVVGRDATWTSGSLHPDGSGFPFIGAKEDMFVGGTFNGPQYLADRRTGGPCTTAGCLDADFNNAQNYYKLLSTSWAAVADSATYAIQFSGITLTCASMATDTYVITISPAAFSTVTYWAAVGCNPNSALVVNIIGAGSSVLFAGATQTIFRKEKVIYNVVPTANTPSVEVQVSVNGNLLAPASQYNQPGGVFIGQVIVANLIFTIQINRIFCAPVAPPPNPPPSTNLCPAWETACAGMDLVLNGNTFSFRDFNVISFQDFTAKTGDVEGRLAVQRDASLGAGYSVGYELQTSTNQPDRSLPFSLIVGRDLSWISGALFPNGNGIPYPGAREDMFVGGTFTSPQPDLIERRTGGPGSLETEFTDAHTCYNGYSNTIAAQADNVVKSIEWSGLSITCNSATASDYVVSLTPAELAQVTYTTLGNCNFQARWYINIRGTEDVELTGGSFPAIPGGIVYNVIGQRNVHVHDTLLGGHLLAPAANLNQTNGVIVGKVVAQNIEFSLQINKQNTCPTPTVVQIPSVVVAPSVGLDAQMLNTAFLVGDEVKSPFPLKVVAAANGKVTFDKPATLAAGQVLIVSASSDDSRTPTAGQSTSSAVSAAASLFVVILALAF